LRKLKKIFISFALAIVFALLKVKPAFAAIENIIPPCGNVSYSAFL
jgi:hypothetical protein